MSNDLRASPTGEGGHNQPDVYLLTGNAQGFFFPLPTPRKKICCWAQTTGILFSLLFINHPEAESTPLLWTSLAGPWLAQLFLLSRFSGYLIQRNTLIQKTHGTDFDSFPMAGMCLHCTMAASVHPPVLTRRYLHFNHLEDIDPQTFSNVPSLERL